MCEFCIKHGEGKKWYLNAKNYSDDLLSDIKRRKFSKDFFYWIKNMYNANYNVLKLLPFKYPVLGNILSWGVKRYFLYKHWGQIVPREDVKKILDLTNSITRIPCICRTTTTGKEHRVCFLISINPAKTGVASIVDQSFFGGPNVAKFEEVEKEWTLNFIKEAETKGMIQTIWAFRAPFIAALCNCDISTGCIAMQMYKEIAPVVFRAEYIAQVDRNSCIGCQECIKICQFTAIKFDQKTKKIEINPKKCYGCGICRTVCKKNAIYLEDRKSMPQVAHLW